ncbi:MAG TPA: C_GCAxxG_C_C family protein [Candidatus Limivicinus faecipullorum]|nr:C_GCAxxG_C_C family protein [Candidatus Limivicinus faecipullorum]
MSIKEKAVEFHGKGYNCAQSVLASCGEYTGRDEKTLLAVSGGFGGGVRCGEICGAVTGGVMAIGLCNPYNDCTDAQAKERIAALTREFTGKFKAEYGCLRCNDLKAGECDCNGLIAYCAAAAEEIIKKNK